MPQPPSKNGGPLPRWLVLGGSALIVWHLAAIVLPVLNTASGPWPMPTGRSMAEPPQFARALNGLTTIHDKYLRLVHNYHHASNRPGDVPAIAFEVRLTDGDGRLLQTMRFPDPAANRWLRHRQELLAGALGPDIPVEAPGGEVIGAPGGNVPTQSVWLIPEDQLPPSAGGPGPRAEADRKPPLQLRELPQHLIPRNREVMKPIDLAVVVARSYARHLCRAHGAARAEIIRVTKDPVPPAVLFGGEPPPQSFETLTASFGEMSP
jgi:hypothetical protein